MTRKPFIRKVLAFGLFLPALTFQALAQKGSGGADWRYISGDAGGTKYSPLDQIDASNVGKLKIAWRWTSQNFGPRPDYNLEVTPLAVNGRLYFAAGVQRAAIAVDGATGQTLWAYHLDEGERGDRAPRNNNRGVAYWADERGHGRVLLITRGYHLVALDADTGVPVKDFGSDGIVDLWVGLLEGTGRQVEPGDIGASSPAIVVGDVVVVGAAMQSGGAPRLRRPYRPLCAVTVRAPENFFGPSTRFRVWANSATIPGKTIPGNTPAIPACGLRWQRIWNSATFICRSRCRREIIYGGHRPGDNVFADSLVCLDAKTGKRIWHFQAVHHDIWDWDLASQPVLMDVTIEGRPVKAVAQVTKQGLIFVFDRVTGKPVWPIEERPVPQSTVPGEITSPTQPFPTKPLPFDRSGIGPDDVNDLTPEIKAEALRIISDYKIGPLYTPSILQGEGGKKGTLIVPHNQGSANWQGAAADPETGMLYIPSETTWWASAMVPGSTRGSDMNYVDLFVRVDTPFGLPLVKGPWGRVTAINMHTGDHAWMVPNGHAPKAVAENPKLAGVDLSGVGQPERAPLLVTKTLLFSGDGSGMFSSGPGGGGPLFRALDKATGKTLHEMKLPANETGIPMTYLANGKQYVVVAIGNRDFPAELIALTLP